MLMITKVHTCNSIYEIDWSEERIRRIDGKAGTTDRFSPQGEWKPYVNIRQCNPGAEMVIQWPDGQPVMRDSTVTSVVLALEEPWLSEVLET